MFIAFAFFAVVIALPLWAMVCFDRHARTVTVRRLETPQAANAAYAALAGAGIRTAVVDTSPRYAKLGNWNAVYLLEVAREDAASAERVLGDVTVALRKAGAVGRNAPKARGTHAPRHHYP